MERNSHIVFLRASATIAVVVFHALGYYTYGWPFGEVKIPLYWNFDRVINQVNMPLFITMSAFLYAKNLFGGKYSDNVQFIKNKCFRILFPYMYWSIFQIIIFPATTNWEMIYEGCLHLWFLLMLFNIFIISTLIRNLLYKDKAILFLFAIFIICPPPMCMKFHF